MEENLKELEDLKQLKELLIDDLKQLRVKLREKDTLISQLSELIEIKDYHIQDINKELNELKGT